VYTFFWHPLYIYIYICTEGAKKCIHIRGCQKMYTHFKRCYLCKLYTHQRVPKMYTHFKRCYLRKLYTHQRVTKQCIHILRDVIYVKCAYIFWHPLYIYICTEGAKKMYTHQRVPKKVYTF